MELNWIVKSKKVLRKEEMVVVTEETMVRMEKRAIKIKTTRKTTQRLIRLNKNHRSRNRQRKLLRRRKLRLLNQSALFPLKSTLREEEHLPESSRLYLIRYSMSKMTSQKYKRNPRLIRSKKNLS